MAQNLDFVNLRPTLFGEFRRLALALKEYRSAAAGKLVAAAEESHEAETQKVG